MCDLNEEAFAAVAGAVERGELFAAGRFAELLLMAGCLDGPALLFDASRVSYRPELRGPLPLVPLPAPGFHRPVARLQRAVREATLPVLSTMVGVPLSASTA